MDETNARASQSFHVILASVSFMNLFIFVYLLYLLHTRFVTDVCEPLALFLLGYHSLPDHLFQSQSLGGLHSDDWKVSWIIKRQLGQLVVVEEDEASLLEDENETSSVLRLRPWRLHGSVAHLNSLMNVKRGVSAGSRLLEDVHSAVNGEYFPATPKSSACTSSTRFLSQF
jgi:hypothetical protein